MPSPKRIDQKWRPTIEQIAEVARLLDEGYDPAYVRQRVVDPNTGDPVSVGLFRRAFCKQLEARAKRLTTMDAFKPQPRDRIRVKSAVIMGYPLEIVARMIINPLTAGHISVNMLKRHFRDELDLAEILTTSDIVHSVSRAARRGDMRAAAYYLDNIAKKRKVEGEGAKTGMIVLPADTPEEQWSQMAAAHQDKIAEAARG